MRINLRAAGLAILAVAGFFFAGLNTGRKITEEPRPQVIVVHEAKTHTVVRMRPFQVQDVYCPTESDCRAEYVNGEWRIVQDPD